MIRRVYRPFCVKTWISFRFTASAALAIAIASSVRAPAISSLPERRRRLGHLAFAEVLVFVLVDAPSLLFFDFDLRRRRPGAFAATLGTLAAFGIVAIRRVLPLVEPSASDSLFSVRAADRFRIS